MSSPQPQNSQPRQFRVFLASPGDVTDERALALKVLERLPYDPFLRGKVALEVVAWDKLGAGTPMQATMTPQEAIAEGLPKPSECDLVVAVFWSRLGTPLPEDWVKPEALRYLSGTEFEPLDARYLSGTEWEYFDALQAAEAHGKPKVLVYRRTEKRTFDPDEPDYDENGKQWKLVKAFFDAFRNPDGSLRRGYNEYAAPADFEQDFEDHLRNLIKEGLETPEAAMTRPEPASTEPPLWQGSPFPGLRPFTNNDWPIFFGRSRETDELIRKLADPDNRFLAVIGASGSGKSSLVWAGLIPRLLGQAAPGADDPPRFGPIPGSQDWVSVRFTPGELGDNPFIALASGFKPVLEQQGRLVRDEADKLLQDASALDELVRLMLEERPEWAELLLFVDQFEETFTVVGEEYRGPFIALLTHAAKRPRLRTVVTLRADFYHRCVEQPTLAELLNAGAYNLAAPGVGALHEMITRPAARAGLSFEDGLAERILDDTGTEPGALPLMAFALAELYEAGKADRQLTHAAYDEFDGVRGAISKRAEETFIALDTGAQATLDHVFRELVEVEKAEESWVATRRRALLSEVARTPGAEKLVAEFTDARLLVQSREEDDDSPMVEVAHEALLRNWRRLVDWIEATGNDLRLLRQLRRSATEWQQQDKKSAFLWPRRRWREARAMVARLQPELAEPESGFLRASRRHTRRQFSLLGAGLATAVLIVGFIGWLGYEQITIPEARGILLARLGLDYREPEMVWIEPGEFWMGSAEDDPDANDNEKPRYKVVIRKPFEIGKYEVTFDEYDLFARLTGRPLPNHGGMGRGRRPVINVSWEDAVAYADWLSEQIGKNYRLPTEAEWEYAARAGTETRYWWGDELGQNRANCGYCGSQWDGIGTAPVGSFPANPFGLHDTAGNAWEWVQDWYSDYAQDTVVDPTGPAGGEERVLRGGSWILNGWYARSALRSRSVPGARLRYYGFRLARGQAPGGQAPEARGEE